MGNYEKISSETNFDIDEILQSYNKELNNQKDDKELFENISPTKKKEVDPETDVDTAINKTTEAKSSKKLVKSPSKKDEGDLMVAEDVENGSVTIQDVKNLLGFSVGNCGFFLYFLFCFGSGFLQLLTTYWVALWTE